jgi:hypothetical protein
MHGFQRILSLFLLAFSGAVSASGEIGSASEPRTREDFPRNVISIHPISLSVNLTDNFGAYQVTYERLSESGRFSNVWDPVLFYNNEDEPGLKHNFQILWLPLYGARWYFQRPARGLFGGFKAGYFHFEFLKEDTGFDPEKDHRQAEMGFVTGEFGFKAPMGPIAFHTSVESGVAVGYKSEIPETDASTGETEKETGIGALPLLHLNVGFGFAF